MISTPEPELTFEKNFIDYATMLGGTKQWQYLPNIKTTDQLWANFRKILQDNNPGRLDKPLSDGEFAQVKRQISDLHTPYEAGRWLYGVNGTASVEISRDDGTNVILTVFDQDQVGSGNTQYQIVNQIERPAIIPGKRDRRFDVTFLINGLPIIQVEEKKSNEMQALEQMGQYIGEKQYSDIFSVVQILIGMSPTGIRYMANTTADQFNTDFAFRWQHKEDNSPVLDWKDFSNLFLNIPMAHYMSTSYMILDGTKNRQSLKVMRSYQVYATRAVVSTLRDHTFGIDPQEAGYIWHTTGSGKTISSFKTAWLAQRLPNVDAVVFMVDRIALTNQTAENYKAYDPDSNDENKNGVVSDTANIKVLRRKIRESKGITVTSIQKMDRLVSQDSFKAPEKNIVFIVDEAHRSTAGDMMKRIKKAFPNSAWIGYTGTPSFEGITTESIFGDPLHIYTIREAIADHNVLGFQVDFETTLPKEELEKHYLPTFFKNEYPEWTDKDVQHKIDNLSAEDMDDMVKPGVYDNNENHVKLVVKDVLDNWKNRSAEYRYSALFTTHVGGNQASTPMAMMYYDEFKAQNARLKHPLKIAVTFSQDNSNGKNMINTNRSLSRVIKDYSDEFHVHFDDTTVKEYTEDVVSRLNRSIDDGNYLDLVIVVDQLLTGFDAPYLNTLYVDRTLHGKNLIQAYSRTNRIQNNTLKPYGRIVNFRWPAQSKRLMNEALSMYANRESANTEDSTELIDDGIIAKDYNELKSEARGIVKELKKLTDNVTKVPANTTEQDALLTQLNKYNSTVSSLKQCKEFDYDEPEALLDDINLSPEDEQRLTGPIASDLRTAIAERTGVEPFDIELALVHVNEVKVDYDYLEILIAKLANEVQEDRMDDAKDTFDSIKQRTSQDENRQRATAYEDTATDLFNRNLSADQYPVNPEDVSDLVKNHTHITKNNEIAKFIKKWGLLDIPASDIQRLLDRHVAGSDDYDSDNSLRDMIKTAQSNYAEYTDDPEVTSLSRIKYRNGLREAFAKFADHIVRTYGNY